MHRHGRGYGRPFRPLWGWIWILGFFFMARYGLWWPGILILVGISIILGSAFRQDPPQPFDTRTPQAPQTPPHPVYPAPVAPAAPAPVAPAPAAQGQHRADLLPATCGRCGAPMRTHEVKWTGPQSASCPYCGSTLSMGGINGKSTPRTWG